MVLIILASVTMKRGLTRVTITHMVLHQSQLEGASEHGGLCLETDLNRVSSRLRTLQLPGPRLCLAVPTYLTAGEALHLDEGLYPQPREGSSGVSDELIDTTP